MFRFYSFGHISLNMYNNYYAKGVAEEIYKMCFDEDSLMGVENISALSYARRTVFYLSLKNKNKENKNQTITINIKEGHKDTEYIISGNATKKEKQKIIKAFKLPYKEEAVSLPTAIMNMLSIKEYAFIVKGYKGSLPWHQKAFLILSNFDLEDKENCFDDDTIENILLKTPKDTFSKEELNNLYDIYKESADKKELNDYLKLNYKI